MNKENYKVLPNEVLERRFSLAHLGIGEYAWKSDNILEILEVLSEREVPVLGGDVYRVANDRIERTYDGWFINDDGTSEFVKKSLEKATRYIKDYERINGEQFVYTLVF